MTMTTTKATSTTTQALLFGLALAAATWAPLASAARRSCKLNRLLGEDYGNNEILDVLVVGAGMSGLGAASKLVDLGKKIAVVEYRHEVGGRMRTKTGFGEPAGDYFDGTIELGANWFYGGYGATDHYDNPISDGPVNPMKNFALNAQISFGEEIFNGRGMDMYDISGDEPERFSFVQVRDTLDEFRPVDTCVTDAALKIFRKLDGQPRKMIGAKTILESLKEDCNFTATTPMLRLLERIYYDEEVLTTPNDSSQFSFVPWGYDDFSETREEFANATTGYDFQVTFVTGQNGGLTEVARKYAELNDVLPRIVFNAEVKKIKYRHDPVVTIVKIKGEKKRCSIRARKLIFTGSPNVVKRGQKKIFNPKIKGVKKNPVELNSWTKVFMQFPKAFWNEIPFRPGPFNVSNYNYIMLAEEEARKGCNIWFNLDWETDLRERTDPAFNRLMPGSRIMFAWMAQNVLDTFGGETDYAFNYTDLLDPEGDVQRCLEPLKKAYGDAFVNPSAVVASDWVHDPSAYGSWNHFKDDPSLSNNKYYKFYEPRENRLWLSGASSCRRSYRNMQGAFFAGIRDAQWVADSLDLGDDVLAARPDSICDYYEFPLPENYAMPTQQCTEDQLPDFYVKGFCPEA